MKHLYRIIAVCLLLILSILALASFQAGKYR